jgi:hypothetical protein
LRGIAHGPTELTEAPPNLKTFIICLIACLYYVSVFFIEVYGSGPRSRVAISSG